MPRNLEKQRAHSAKYYRANRENILARHRVNRIRNREGIRATKAEYRRNNREKISAYREKYNRIHREENLAWVAKYKRTCSAAYMAVCDLTGNKSLPRIYSAACLRAVRELGVQI